MQNTKKDHPLKGKILELLDSSGIENIASYSKMLEYTIEIFEDQGLGQDYYGYHNIDHELEVTYITLLAAIWENKIQKFGFAKSILDSNTILTTLRLNDDDNAIIGYAKGGPLESYQLYSGIEDENFGKNNTVFLEPIAMKMGYWGLGGGTRLRKVFSLLANTKRYRYLTSFALRDLIQQKMGSENVEFVTLLDPEHWDYYRVDLMGGIV